MTRRLAAVEYTDETPSFVALKDGLFLNNHGVHKRLTYGHLELLARWHTEGQAEERSGVVLQANESTLYLEFASTTSTRILHNKILAAGVRVAGVKLKDSDEDFKGTAFAGLSFLQIIAHYVNATHTPLTYKMHTAQGWDTERRFYTQGDVLVPTPPPQSSSDTTVQDIGEVTSDPTRVSRGSPEEFCEYMRIVQHHPGYNFAVSCAFAGVVAPFLSLPRGIEGGFHLFGDSSEGKTTALRLMNSIQGVTDLKTWDSTSNSLELIAERLNHATLALDEMGQARDATVVLDAAYKLAQGQGKNRMSATGTFVEPVRFNLLFLSSGEMSFEDYHRQTVGRLPMSGQRLRFLDLPWDAAMNPPLHKDETIANQLFEKLLTCIETQRGHINLVIEHLAKKEVQADLQRRFASALGEFTTQSRKGARVRTRFALLLLGAEIAKRVGVLPSTWDPSVGTVRVFDRFEKNAKSFDEGTQLATMFYKRINSLFNDKTKIFNGALDKKTGILSLYGPFEEWAPYNTKRLKEFLGKKEVLIKDEKRKTYNLARDGKHLCKVRWKKLEEIVG